MLTYFKPKTKIGWLPNQLAPLICCAETKLPSKTHNKYPHYIINLDIENKMYQFFPEDLGCLLFPEPEQDNQVIRP